jgi:hypothetical protein
LSAGRVIKSLRSLGILDATELPVARELAPGRATAYRGPWPIRSHRTLAEVDAGQDCRTCGQTRMARCACRNCPIGGGDD